MIIGIDGNEANITNRVGIGQFALQMLIHIHDKDDKNTFIIYLKNPPLPDMPQASAHWQYQVFGPKKFWTRFALPLHLLFGRKLDIFYSPSHYTPFLAPCPTICSITDLGFLHYPTQFTSKDRYQLTHWTEESIRKSLHIIAISEFTKKEIIATYHIDPAKISVIYPGVKLPQKIDAKNPFPDFSYFLSLGTLKPSKNIPFLIDSFALFSKNHPEFKLVVTGKKGWLYDQVFATVTHHRLEDKVIFLDYINEAQKWPLLKNAKALIIPSLYEGFGIPAVEAMALGTPVIASHAASLPEVVGNSAILIDPSDSAALSSAMNNILKPSLFQKYSRLGISRSSIFTWDKAATTFIQLLKEL